MTLNIKDDRADQLARELAATTGESLTRAVSIALEERLVRVRGRAGAADLVQELDDIAVRCSALPTLDDRSAEEILGYDDRGLPV